MKLTIILIYGELKQLFGRLHSASIMHFMYLQEKLVLQEKNWAVPPLEQGVRIAYASDRSWAATLKNEQNTRY